MKKLLLAIWVFMPFVLLAQLPDFQDVPLLREIPEEIILSKQVEGEYLMDIEDALVCCNTNYLPALGGDTLTISIYYDFGGEIVTSGPAATGHRKDAFPIWIPFRVPHWVKISDGECTLVLAGDFLSDGRITDWKMERVFLDCSS